MQICATGARTLRGRRSPWRCVNRVPGSGPTGQVPGAVSTLQHNAQSADVVAPTAAREARWVDHKGTGKAAEARSDRGSQTEPEHLGARRRGLQDEGRLHLHANARRRAQSDRDRLPGQVRQRLAEGHRCVALRQAARFVGRAEGEQEEHPAEEVASGGRDLQCLFAGIPRLAVARVCCRMNVSLRGGSAESRGRI